MATNLAIVTDGLAIDEDDRQLGHRLRIEVGSVVEVQKHERVDPQLPLPRWVEDSSRVG